ncbi:anti-sigma factor antagonist [Planobispora rosea]|uniref:Anti-sigma factor antagonist n=1 Tax=Planobispora rosea TaxID=35762 RepID=A0A8J3WGZ2_PLARO|nr:STAS domain-containing protein [Planobispora rosea]GGT05572.1 anti-sigma factor antagonist [Planobispora rosea]GIH88938.1 anti-sigma factor antagonist [Planobispora rosea]
MTMLSLTTTDHPAVTVITLDGEIDVLTADHLRQSIDQALARGRSRLVIDAAGLGFCDSGGLHTLIAGQRRATSAGGWLHLAHAHGYLQRLLELTQLIELFPRDPQLERLLRR